MKYYSEITPIESPIPAARQGARRHYGVHPYFTRRPYNVVRDYILKYSRPGDRVLDPFGGSGVTAIEAFLENRVGMHNDINPLANFIASGIAELHKGNLADYEESLVYIERKCRDAMSRIHESTENELQNLKRTLRLPENVPLPRNSDAKHYYDLFSLKQLLSLATLKEAIDSIANEPVRKGMLLAWSATLSKLNKTFLSAEGRAESRGGSSIFSIYRYKIAKQPVELSAWETFYERATNVIKAKVEIEQAIQLKKQMGGFFGSFEPHAKDVEDLAAEFPNSIDYIFTDPPYGGHISYLDLSTLWNSWLGLLPDTSTKEKELIVGGDLNLTERSYIERLGKSVEACVKMLKKDRWLSVVFQHWNISYFEAILSAATESGAELRAAISQVGDPIWSMHKKKNNSVLAGEMILTFHKTGAVRSPMCKEEFDIPNTLKRILENTKSDKIFGEYLFNQLIIEAWRRSAIHSLEITKQDFMQLLIKSGWDYDEEKHYWVKGKPQRELLFTAPG